VIRPYNHSIFSIRQHYLTTFPEDTFKRPDEDSKNVDSSKIYKLNYTINLLPYVTSHLELRPDRNGNMKEVWVNNNHDVMDLLSRCTEWSVFKTKPVVDLI
jgi:hypothetical protein